MNITRQAFPFLVVFALSCSRVFSIEASINGIWSSNRELSIAVSSAVIDALPVNKAAEVRGRFGTTRLTFNDSTLTILQMGAESATAKTRFKIIERGPDRITIELLDRPPSFHDGTLTMHLIGRTRFALIGVAGMMEFFDLQKNTDK